MACNISLCPLVTPVFRASSWRCVSNSNSNNNRMMESVLDAQAGSCSELVRPSVYYRRYLSTPHNVIRTTKKNLTKESYMKKIFTLALAMVVMAFTVNQVVAQG